jgi:hypothetical protein
MQRVVVSLLILVWSLNFTHSALINRKLLIGVVPVTSDVEFLKIWRSTFEDYLSDTAGRDLDPEARFEIVLLSLTSVFDAVKKNSIDFLFVNPSLFSCLEIEYSGIFLTSEGYMPQFAFTRSITLSSN